MKRRNREELFKRCKEENMNVTDCLVGLLNHIIGDEDREFRFELTLEMGAIKQMHQEYFIYDTKNLIGTVGGTLSLFVGFSFFDFVLMTIDFLFDKLK